MLVGAIGCGPASRTGATTDATGAVDTQPQPPPVDGCGTPATPAGPEVELAPPFDTLYTAYDLGVVPGVPDPLGGTAILAGHDDTLLVAGGSEDASGAIYSIGVTRACGHITGFTGTAVQVATTPYVDANLVYASSDLLLYSEWPEYTVSQLAGAAMAPNRSTDLRTLGMTSTDDSGPGGLGYVPPSIPGAAHQLRLVTWPMGRWFHVATSPDANLLAITGVTQTQTLPNNPGGFAYVPAGSPGFTAQSLIVAEWSQTDVTLDRVAVYTVDDMGDPMVATRHEFFQKFPRPWGAYFEPVTGDYLFLSWGAGIDHVYIVQGFVPPPPIQ